MVLKFCYMIPSGLVVEGLGLVWLGSGARGLESNEGLGPHAGALGFRVLGLRARSKRLAAL